VRRHDLDVFSLVAGLVFVVVAAGHLIDEANGPDFDGRWVVPVVMVAIGVVGLASLVRGRDDRPTDQVADELPAPVGEPEAAGETDTDETLVLSREEPEGR